MIKRAERHGTADRAITYRPDIDGLRAVAVVSVILFHAFDSVLPGGYVGVDIFFVISGYLITSIIVSELAKGQFSIVAFYERRIRRIGPALVAVLVFTFVVAVFLLVPSNFRSLSQSLVATVFSASNFLFWYQSGYFIEAAQFRPLLHTWSLGVEEQFYLLFPALLAMLARWPQKTVIAVVVTIAVVSLGLSQWGVLQEPTAAFFLLPMRAWELMIGALLAMGVVPPLLSRWSRELEALVGAALIIFGVFWFSPATAFPGVNALVPCMGAAMIIHAGARGKSGVSRLLGSPPMVAIGVISYSLYLWHWPILCFTRIATIFEPTVAVKILAIAATFVLSAISWRYVERPFRGKGAIIGRRGLYASTVAAVTVLTMAGIFGHLSQGWPGRLPQGVVDIAAFRHSQSPRIAECLARSRYLAQSSDDCRFGTESRPSVVVWGDSHASALVTAVAAAAERHGQSIIEHAFYLCPPIFDVDITNRPGDSCRAFNRAALQDLAASRDIKAVVLAARWPLYVEGLTGLSNVAEQTVIETEGGVRDKAAREKAFGDGLIEVVQTLRAANKTVFLVYPVPEMRLEIPAMLAQLKLRGGAPDLLALPTEDYRERNRFVFSVFDRLAQAGMTTAIRPDTRFCDRDLCRAAMGWVPLYSDTDHVSLVGAGTLSPLFDRIFEQLGGTEPQVSIAAEAD